MVLKDLDLSVIDLYSSDWGTYSDFCFDMADTVDLNHWINAFKDDKSEKETFPETIGVIGDTSGLILKASYEIIRGLVIKLDLIPK